MTRNHLWILCLVLLASSPLSAQTTDTLVRPCFVGSTFFMAGNFLPEPPSYYQLNLGYRLSSKDVLSVEMITWIYRGPLGRPYGPDYENPSSNFPGYVRAFGAGLAYKRFLWKQWYGQVHATALRQHYMDESGERIQHGFQLFNTLRLGYQFRFFKNRFFLEPSIAMTFWPINTNLPDSFQVEEDRWNTFFLGEPGLHFGFNF
ncbi:MAG: hypothetical protein AAGH79_06335 [Bacteroidota bacterium]